jgi:putative ABC transport system permease protein
MRFRVEFRCQWRAWLAATLLAGLAGGVLVGVAAGARRTDSAWPRYRSLYRVSDARVWGYTGASPSVLETVERLPMVAAGSIRESLGFGARDARGRPIPGPPGPHGMTVFASTDGHDGVTVDRWKLLSGRLPDSRRTSEALLDSRAARTFGVKPGDTIRLNLSDGPVRLKVVGVAASTDPVANPDGVVRLTPAFYRSHGDADSYDYVLDVRLKHGAADFQAFRSAVNSLGAGLVDDQSQRSSEIQVSIHGLAQAVWLGVGAGALLMFLLVTQSLARLSVAASPRYPTLRAIGMTSRQLIAIGIARAGAIALAAAALTVGVALALSPLAPIGYARELEPTPGFAVDSLVVGLGEVAVAVAVLLGGSLVAWRAADSLRRAQPGEGSARVRAADALARWGLPAPATTGVRLALARPRGANAPSAGSALVGVTLAVSVIAAALTFSASLHHLFTTPTLFGQNWDYRVDAPDSAKIGRILSDRAISGLAIGDDKGTVLVNGRQVGAWAAQALKGSIQPTIVAGRMPRRYGEIALGPKTMRALGVHMGQTVDVTGPGGPARMRLVGRVVLPGSWHNPLGEGATMTWAAFDGLATQGGTVMFARIAPWANRARTLAMLERLFGVPTPGLPTAVANFGGVNHMPIAVSGVLVAISLGALTLTLAGAVRRRRRYLAILKTLGFDRRQLLATVAWQATTLTAIGLLIGLPVGDAVGRWAWNLFADQLGVVPVAMTPVPLLMLLIPGAILLANLFAIVPARLAAGTRPALALRAE